VKPVRFLDEALSEFLEQILYYEERQKGLGDRFRLAVEAATTLAATHPKLGSPWKLKTRRVFAKASSSPLFIGMSQTNLSFSPWHTSGAGRRIGAGDGDA
jgi:hypothetical protein